MRVIVMFIVLRTIVPTKRLQRQYLLAHLRIARAVQYHLTTLLLRVVRAGAAERAQQIVKVDLIKERLYGEK